MDKKHIINEIIRTANENQGIPLGHRKFASETGIKYSDWNGKYWAKWSDAVREAGFKPNKRKLAYDENLLIGHVISLIREIKRFPTASDFRLKAHNTNGFPWRFARLGKKSEMAQKILNYCKSNPKYEDVIEVCKEISNSSEKTKEFDIGKDNLKFGYV